MAIEPITFTPDTQAEQDEFIQQFAVMYPGETVTTMAEVGAIMLRQAKSVCSSCESSTNGSVGLAAYTAPDMTIS